MLVSAVTRASLHPALMRLPVRCGLHTSPVTRAKLYSAKHEWVELVGGTDSDTVRVGVTRYAAEALGDVVYAQLPREEEELEAGGEAGAVESVKAASEIYSPVSGTVTQHNIQVEDKPGIINSSPEDDAWLFELNLSNRIELKNLMDKEGYEKFLKSVTDDLE